MAELSRVFVPGTAEPQAPRPKREYVWNKPKASNGSALDAFDPACDTAKAEAATKLPEDGNKVASAPEPEPAPEAAPVEAASDEADFDDSEIETPEDVAFELDTWRAVLSGPEKDKAGLFERAAKALMPLCDKHINEIALRIVDELQALAEAAGIGPDKAQSILADAKEEAEAKEQFTLLKEPEKKPEDAGDEPLRTVSAAEFEGKPVPPRQWIVLGLIPDRNVTLLTGDGDAGKSFLALQLGAAVAIIGSQVKWIGQSVTGGAVLYLSAEDEIDEHHRRLFSIKADYGCRFLDLKNLEIIPLAGEDAVLAAPANRSEIIKATPLWQRLIKLIEIRRRKLVILDTLADLFAGNETSRPQGPPVHQHAARRRAQVRFSVRRACASEFDRYRCGHRIERLDRLGQFGSLTTLSQPRLDRSSGRRAI
jgi:hypothetical protein